MALTRARAYQILDSDIKQSVRAATTTSVTLSGGAPNSLDSISLAANDRILVKDQSPGSGNGIYVVQTLGTGSNGTWVRASDFDTTSKVTSGLQIYVEEGSANGDKVFGLTTNNPITLGTTALTFSVLSSAGTASAGGADTNIQYNSSGTFAGSANLTFDGSNVDVAGYLDAGNLRIGASGNTIQSNNSNGNILLSPNGTGVILANANITAPVFISNVGPGTAPFTVTSTTQVANLNVASSGTAVTVTGAAQSNITSLGNLTIANIDNIQINDNSITSTNTNGNINLTPNGTGEVVAASLSVSDLTSGRLTLVGSGGALTDTSALTWSGSSLTVTGNVSGGNINTAGAVVASTLTSNIATGTAPFTVTSTTQVANLNVATAGSATTAFSLSGGTAGALAYQSGAGATSFITIAAANTILVSNGSIPAWTLPSSVAVGTVITAAQPNITSVGNLTIANIDNIQIDGNTISSTNTNGNIDISPNGTGNINLNDPVQATSTVQATRFISNVATGTAPFTVTSTTQVANLNVATAGSATTAGTVTTAAQPNITSVGTLTSLTSSGDISAGGRLASTASAGDEGGEITLALAAANTTLNANVTIDVYQNRLRFFEGGGTARGVYIDLTSASAGAGTNLLALSSVPTQIANGTSNVVVASNSNVTVGIAGTANVATFTATGVNISGYTTATGTITADIVATTNNANGTNFKVGDDAWIGDINTADTLTIKGQQNAANGYIVFGNADVTALGRAGTGALTYGGAFAANGTITGTRLISNIATGTAPFTVTSTTQVANLNVATAGSATTAGTVTTAAQPNITSVGTLTSLGVSGAVTASTLVSNVATGTAPFTVTSTTQVANLNVATAGSATTAGTVTTAAQPNITSVGNLTIANIDNIQIDGNTISSTNTNGNIDISPNGTGNINLNDPVQATSTIQATRFISNIATGTAPFTVTSTTQVANLNVATAGSATTAGTVTTAAQPNITSVGTLTGLTTSGDITLNAQSDLRFADGDSSNWVAFQAPATVAANVTWTLPATDGSSGNALLTYGNGILYWGTAGGGGGASVTTDVSAPGSPSDGNLWFDEDDGSIYIFYADGTSSQWVELGSTNGVGAAPGSNTQVVFNDNGVLGASSSLTFASSNLSLSGNLIATGQLRSTITTGTAPLVVSSTTQVANLNVATAGTAGTVTTAAQPNITSVGTLTSLTTSGQLTSTLASGTAPFVVTSTTRVNNLNVAVSGTVTTAAQPNITSVGTLTALTTSGQITSTLTTGTAPFVVTSTTQVANLNVATAGTAGTVITAAQPNITSVGNLTIANVDNIQLDGNTISTTNTNGNLSLTPNGTGAVIVGNATVNTTISTSGITFNTSTTAHRVSKTGQALVMSMVFGY